MEVVNLEVQFILNSFMFLVSGAMVFWMAAGFAMLEVGSVRTKNASTILLKNICLLSITAIMFALVGYNLMYMNVGSYIGTFLNWNPSDSGEFTAGSYSSGSDWFFQMVFVATAASIVSGTLAERIKVIPFLLFVVALTGIIYPIYGAWTWGGGWLAEMGFSDFAGSTIVHSVGGWAALVGAIILGPRVGKYVLDKNGKTVAIPMPGSNMATATLGTFILWLGWHFFNGGSVLALGTGADATTMSNVFVNTTLAAAAGVIFSLIYSKAVTGNFELSNILNGALAGLVAITAGPDTPSVIQAIIIGGVGGILCSIAIPLLDKMKIDDVVGAISVHLVAGIWGTLIVPWTNADASFLTQLIGVAAAGAFVSLASFIVWFALAKTVGIRASGVAESAGLDRHELGTDAYPEFVNAKITDYEQHVV